MSSNVRLVRSTNLRVRAPRVPIDLSVESRTIGTNACYQFLTEDVSRSGLLLVWDRHVKMPFLVNTLIEITIDPDGKHLSRPVQCLGKVVRRDANATEQNGHGARLGIQIVQIDNTDLATWEGCLAELERRFGIEPAPRLAASAS
jgi:hypothetical protein